MLELFPRQVELSPTTTLRNRTFFQNCWIQLEFMTSSFLKRSGWLAGMQEQSRRLDPGEPHPVPDESLRRPPQPHLLPEQLNTGAMRSAVVATP